MINHKYECNIVAILMIKFVCLLTYILYKLLHHSVTGLMQYIQHRILQFIPSQETLYYCYLPLKVPTSD